MYAWENEIAAEVEKERKNIEELESKYEIVPSYQYNGKTFITGTEYYDANDQPVEMKVLINGTGSKVKIELNNTEYTLDDFTAANFKQVKEVEMLGATNEALPEELNDYAKQNKIWGTMYSAPIVQTEMIDDVDKAIKFAEKKRAAIPILTDLAKQGVFNVNLGYFKPIS